MRYLKLYETYKEFSFWDWCKEEGTDSLKYKTHISCSTRGITSLDGIENFPQLEELVCGHNRIKTLKGIEICTKLRDFRIQGNLLTSVEELKYLTNLKEVSCGVHENLNNLKGVEKLYSLTQFQCSKSALKNLEELRGLENLEIREGLYVPGNPFEQPAPIQIYKKFGTDMFGHQLSIFYGYDFQKQFIEEHPEKVADLAPYLDEKIKEEYKDLIEFFNAKL